MLDDASVAFAKMAMEYHVNSMILDNLSINNSSNLNSKVIHNIEYLSLCLQQLLYKLLQ